MSEDKLVLKDLLENRQEELKKLLPKHVSITRFIKSAAMAWFSNPALQKCSKESLIKAVFNAAELGLDFTPAKGHAYLIPFGGEAVFMPGYRGLIDLAKRTGVVKSIQAHIVYDNDFFDIEYGSNPRIKHNPVFQGERGDIVGAYAIAFFSDGSHQPEYMHMDDLEKVRNVSKQKNGTTYKDWTEEMYRKAPVRRLFKFLPSNPDLDKAIEIDNELYDLDNLQPVPEAKPAKSINDLKEKLKLENKDMGDCETPTGAPDSNAVDDGVPSSIDYTLKEMCEKKNIPIDDLLKLQGKLGFHGIDTQEGLEEFKQYVRERTDTGTQNEIINRLKVTKTSIAILENYECQHIWELDKKKAGSVLQDLKKGK